MHHLVIGEGQIGRAIIEQALTDGDSVTVLRRSEITPTPGIDRVAGDVLDRTALTTALAGADAVHASFHAAYDARVWRRDLPPRELAVLDAAADRGIPVVFPGIDVCVPGRGLGSRRRRGARTAGCEGRGARRAARAAPSPHRRAP